jgi:putative transposase
MSCRIMKMSPNNFYYKRVDRKAKDAPVLKLIQEFFEMFPNLGLPSVTRHLKKTMKINKKRIERIMKENGLMNRKRAKKQAKTTNSSHKFQKFENLLKGREKTSKINEVIVGDVTAFDIKGVNHYLALLMDLHSREIVGSAVSEKNDTELVLAALSEALKYRKSLEGVIHHTDADVRYCSDEYVMKLKENKMMISMCVGNAYENAHAESLNKTVKYGEINISDYDTVQEAASGIFLFAERYNSVRPHSAHEGLSPLEFARQCNSK